jgi:hypothetical protein
MPKDECLMTKECRSRNVELVRGQAMLAFIHVWTHFPMGIKAAPV